MTHSYFAPAKINLFLHITGKRTDGYHTLQSVFCALDFGDFLTIGLASDNDPLISLTGADGLTNALHDNLIAKAVTLLANSYPAHARPVCIHLDKRIPTGAGLGGGSSDCATTLIAINELWQLHLTCDELINIGVRLGADVPFFIFAHFYKTAAIAEGIGEQLSPITLPVCEFLLLLPPAHVSTAQLFAQDQLKRDCAPISHQTLNATNFLKLPTQFGNVFERLACDLSPDINSALAYLKSLENQTQTTARMTGTGAVVFLPFTEVNEQTKASFIFNAPCPAILAKPLF